MHALRTVCCIYIEDFRNLLTIYKLWGGKDLGESVDLLLCDHPNIVRRQQDFQNSDHDVFNATDMDIICGVAKYVLQRGVLGHFFWLVVKFPFLWRRFRARKEEVEKGAGETEVVEIEQTPLFNNGQRHNYARPSNETPAVHKHGRTSGSFFGKGIAIYQSARTVVVKCGRRYKINTSRMDNSDFLLPASTES